MKNAKKLAKEQKKSSIEQKKIEKELKKAAEAEASIEGLIGGKGRDWLVGTERDDLMAGGAGDDRIYGRAGNDIVSGNGGKDRIFGGIGDDTLSGGASDDTVYGGGGDDVLRGDEGRDKLYGNTGNDEIHGGEGNDEALGGDGHDRVVGDAGNDRLSGGSGDDVVLGGDGDDTLAGDAGADRLDGGTGDDELVGGEGNDVLNGGAGSDVVDGGIGDDRIVQDYDEEAVDTLSGGEGEDRLILRFSEQEWSELNGGDEALRADIRAYGDLLRQQTGTDAVHQFATMGLAVEGFETLDVLVDGEAVSLDDAAVVANADTFTMPEDEGATLLTVEANDEIADGIAACEIVEGPQMGMLTLEGDAFTFDTAGDFQHLVAGETELVTFSYAVIDTDGDRGEATVQITVEGENDAPEAQDITVETVENESDVVPLAIEEGARTIVNAGGFYVVDMDTREMEFFTRGKAGLTPADVAPQNGVVVYINPNTSNWFIEAHTYSEGVGTAIPPSELQPVGHGPDVLLRDDSYYFLEASTQVSISIPLPEFATADGSTTGSVTLTDLNYEPFATKTVDVGAINFELVPSDVEAALAIAPVVTDVDGDIFTFAVDQTGTEGTVTVNDDGTFTYDQRSAFAHLGEGEIGTDIFAYTTTDEGGASSRNTVTVNVRGTNDGPDARALFASVHAEASAVRPFEANPLGDTDVPNAGLYYVLDYDAQSLTTYDRALGSFSAPENGLVVLVNPNTNSLYLDATAYELGVARDVDPGSLLPTGFGGNYTVVGNQLRLLDGVENGRLDVVVDDLATAEGLATARFTLEGFDYAGPFQTQAASIAGASASIEEATEETSVIIVPEVYDPDGDVFTYTLDTSETRGSVSVNDDGTFTYQALDAFADLDAMETATDTFVYTVVDDAGASDMALVTIEVLGTVTGVPEDAPDLLLA